MAAYLYVLWAVEDGFVKIGISTRISERLAAHSGNSSNPLELRTHALYQFATVSDARRIEQLVLAQMREMGLSYRDKKELFKCPPMAATDLIEKTCQDSNTWSLKNFPFGTDQILRTFGDFPCLPGHGLETLTLDQRKLYWQGIKDALWCLSYMDEARISRVDFWRMHQSVKGHEEIGTEFWIQMIDYYRNHGAIGCSNEHSAEVRKIAESAIEKIKTDRHQAYVDWQEIQGDDRDEAA